MKNKVEEIEKALTRHVIKHEKNPRFLVVGYVLYKHITDNRDDYCPRVYGSFKTNTFYFSGVLIIPLKFLRLFETEFELVE